MNRGHPSTISIITCKYFRSSTTRSLSPHLLIKAVVSHSPCDLWTDGADLYECFITEVHVI
ncbi:hypothetical protein QJS04_geneDACA003819 [Acorus gramineus]|uniref:Uncharacterized protein n=1 Tax=Acorus gramineus TaxID=55184 RepID=A0AAV9BGP0_ACOGR|nr:hypothetical protein QJS04_geneDACA003819 [Acorus gramineus]